MTVGSYLSPLPLPLGFVDFCMQGLRPGQARSDNDTLPNATARCVRLGRRRRWAGGALHGGAFVSVRAEFAQRIVNALSGFAKSPVLIVDYRLIPSIRWDGARRLPRCIPMAGGGYRPEQIVLAGDGGWLPAPALCAAAAATRRETGGQWLIFSVAAAAKAQAGPSQHRDRRCFRRGHSMPGGMGQAAAAKNMVDGRPEDLKSRSDHIESSLPPTLFTFPA